MPNSEEGAPLLGISSNSQRASYATNSTGMEDVVQMTLAWHSIRVTKPGPTSRMILDNINGLAEPKQVVALMGASGAGKTTLLNALMGRNLNGLEVSGETIVGGSSTLKIGDVSGYVQQEELFLPTLTVYEHLMIQGGIRLAGLKKSDLKARVLEIMDELGLFKCRDSIIGLNGIKKGVSGGEAKRLMVASILLDNPSIIFLDEPTTGLDSHMAQYLMNTLKRLAAGGRTIVCTIHQPSSRIFNMLDVVIFLGNGHLAYMGSPHDILKFFDSLELVCPSDYNPADYIIDVLAMDHQNGSAAVAIDRIHKVCKAFTESPLTSEFYQKLLTYEGFSKGEPKLRQRASFFNQFRLILKRSMIDNKRNPALARAKMIQKMVMGLFVGLLYFHTSMNEVGITNINGALFFLVAELTYSTLFGILNFMPNDFPLVVREHFDGLYSVSAYYFARILSYMPMFIVDGFIMMTVSYWMIGLNPNILNYIVCIGIAILVEQSASAFGVMLSTCAPSYSVAISVAGPVLTVMSLTGGFMANVGEIPIFIRWTQYFSWFKYGFEALAINQWRGMSNNTCIGETCRSSDEILERYSFDTGNLWINIFAMFAIVNLYYVIGYIGMYIRVHRSR